jgi:hypothetical protein
MVLSIGLRAFKKTAAAYFDRLSEYFLAGSNVLSLFEEKRD